MKTSVLIAACLLLNLALFSQTPSTANDKNYYLTKSKHQKTLAWIMLGGGVTLTALGFAIEGSNVVTDSKSDNGANVIAIIGIASALGSIPVFISSSHNKRKAMALSFNIEKVPELNVANINSAHLQPEITVHIPL